MEFLIGWIVWVGIWVVVRVARKLRAEKEESLCLTCIHAVVTRGTGGQKWVACSIAGALRPVKFTVCECTGFCVAATAPKLVTIEGFTPDKRKVYAEIVIR